ncbi:MAG: 2-C-methyl-D-erythritol 4-phosphate cytidylyltransferase [Pseudomonadota bacterium]|nr:2-C-methyl-D-erythritol 4-phosphate cytidylyltransferase [Pseudomonadota bacterium]
MDDEKVWAVVPAAGIGARMEADRPKQYLELGRRPILHHALARLCESPPVAGVVVGLRENDPWWRREPFKHSRLLATVTGGAERANTVLNALDYLLEDGAQESDWVMVHDAVRPCLRQGDVGRLVDAVRRDGSGGLLAVPLSDTIKRDDGKSHVTETVPREGLWRAMTPQMFRLGNLRSALRNALDAGLAATDEAAAMEREGCRPLLVACHADNIKITTPEDLPLAARIMEALEE